MSKNSNDRNLIDFTRTFDKPYGPWPSSSETMLSAWIKLDYFDYLCKQHDTPVDFLPDR